MNCVSQDVKDLYHLLEHEFLPLDLARRVQPLLTKISKLGGKLSSASSVPEIQLSQYIPALEKLATLRLLQQVSRVYQTVKIDNLSKMIPFFEFSTVEKISVEAVKHNFVAMSVDHLKGVVVFGHSVYARIRRVQVLWVSDCVYPLSSLQVVELKSGLQNPWAGIVNRSQADITENVGSEYPALLSKVSTNN